MTAGDRFWRHVDKTAAGECWVWTACKTADGYGKFAAKSTRPYKIVSAHRFAYELAVGPIPEGMQIDHLCRNPSCVNPAHLEPVTNRENTMRGLRGALKTECAQGHAWTPENILVRKKWDRTSRVCLICAREHNRNTTERRRQEREAAR